MTFLKSGKDHEGGRVQGHCAAPPGIRRQARGGRRPPVGGQNVDSI